MQVLITWMHYASTFFFSLSLVILAHYLFSSAYLNAEQREARVYLPMFICFCFATATESISCYYAGWMEEFYSTAALTIIPFTVSLIIAIKVIKRRHVKQKEKKF